MKRTPCSQRFPVGLWGVARPGNHRPLPGEGAPSGSARHFQISATGKHRENPQPAPSKADALGGPGGLAFPGSLSWSFKTVPAPTGRLAGGRVSHLVAEAPGETCITKRSFSNLLSRLRDLLTRGTWPHLVAPALRASVSRWRTGLHGRSLHLVTSEGPSPYSGSWDERQRLPSHLILLARLRASTTKTKPQVQRPGEREGRQTCAVG